MLGLDAQLEAIDAGMLEPIVRKVLDRDRATANDWTYVPLAHGAINL